MQYAARERNGAGAHPKDIKHFYPDQKELSVTYPELVNKYYNAPKQSS